MRTVLNFSHKNRLVSISLGLLTLALVTISDRTIAAPPATAPPQLQNMLVQIDAAANQKDIQAVMQFYSPTFAHTDGLTYQDLEKALTALWKQYPQLKYETKLQSWQAEGDGIVAETVTNITGTQTQDSRNLALKATIRSRQRYENQKIVRQEVLAERSQLSTGTKPPTLDIKLPQSVKPGQQYNFDAVVLEPLKDDYLLGAAIEEAVAPGQYFSPTQVKLDLLPAGGLFKIGRVPMGGSDRWLSAVVVRGDGLTQVTQRLNVLGGTTNPRPSGRRLNIR
ncbi:nuclear transport factor 2 family protein [Synechocystis sp. PCC 7509]|uniref:nuclear transport factor 2 family protein n=1 Tax=Synechocystis sp. PCC 7509 TaxID=927677 RepID=UPI0002AC407A|nr:nuclear transport factor 2 family protein [Synechocystis sp. PCC 7509]